MRIQLRPVSVFASFTPVATVAIVASAALFAAVGAWSAHMLLAPLPHSDAQAQAPVSIDASAAATLFGATPDKGHRDDVQLLGILAFEPRHAAAIVSIGGEAARVIPVRGELGSATTLAEVRAHSIVVEHNGVRREISLPAIDAPSAYVR